MVLYHFISRTFGNVATLVCVELGKLSADLLLQSKSCIKDLLK